MRGVIHPLDEAQLESIPMGLANLSSDALIREGAGYDELKPAWGAPWSAAREESGHAMTTVIEALNDHLDLITTARLPSQLQLNGVSHGSSLQSGPRQPVHFPPRHEVLQADSG